MIVQFALRRATTEEWATDNPILADGEPGYDSDLHMLKIGDGLTAWTSLPTLFGGSGGSGGGPVAWADITSKPVTFPPAPHQHPTSDIVNFVEALQDTVAATIVAGTGMTAVYDDTNGLLTLSSTGGGGGTGVTDPEVVRDTIATALKGSGLITVTANDAADTITLATTATANSTDAQLRDRTTHTGIEPVSGIAAGSLLVVQKSGTTWPARPTSRPDVCVAWKGPDPTPAIITTGTGGMLNNVDVRWVTT